MFILVILFIMGLVCYVWSVYTKAMSKVSFSRLRLMSFKQRRLQNLPDPQDHIAEDGTGEAISPRNSASRTSTGKQTENSEAEAESDPTIHEVPDGTVDMATVTEATSRKNPVQGHALEGLIGVAKASFLERLSQLWLPSRFSRVLGAIDPIVVPVLATRSFIKDYKDKTVEVWVYTAILFVLLCASSELPSREITRDDWLNLRNAIYTPEGIISWLSLLSLFIVYAVISHQFLLRYNQARIAEELYLSNSGPSEDANLAVKDRAITTIRETYNRLTLGELFFSHFFHNQQSDQKEAFRSIRFLAPTVSALSSIVISGFTNVFIDSFWVTQVGGFSDGYYTLTVWYMGGAFFFFLFYMIMQVIEVSDAPRRLGLHANLVAVDLDHDDRVCFL